ncbi:MAG: hypothetical protein ACRD0K_04845 [Egibacteraceae bacterium]
MIQADGEDSQELVEYLRRDPRFSGALAVHEIGFEEKDKDLGRTRELVNHEGRFRARGDSFALHQSVVARTVEVYRRFVELVEARAIRLKALEGGGWNREGAPIVINFSRPVSDLGQLLETLFSCREPYRLWGVPREVGEGIFRIEAVDLHVGRRVSMDITSGWIRLYLRIGDCGNTVARLLTNLQHTVDADVGFVDPALQSALALSSAVAAA